MGNAASTADGVVMGTVGRCDGHGLALWATPPPRRTACASPWATIRKPSSSPTSGYRSEGCSAQH